jgi:hypothetical protein
MDYRSQCRFGELQAVSSEANRQTGNSAQRVEARRLGNSRLRVSRVESRAGRGVTLVEKGHASIDSRHLLSKKLVKH